MAKAWWLIPVLAAGCLIPAAFVFLRKYCALVKGLLEEDLDKLRKTAGVLKSRDEALSAELRRFDEDVLSIAGLY
ncbi:MAG: hypothetical protein HY589_04590, partial [Candidatus Omnitrophica bacterium]|nr:hypothetical protein [Candidatus Omnitrophota bacterium]